MSPIHKGSSKSTKLYLCFYYKSGVYLKGRRTLESPRLQHSLNLELSSVLHSFQWLLCAFSTFYTKHLKPLVQCNRVRCRRQTICVENTLLAHWMFSLSTIPGRLDPLSGFHAWNLEHKPRGHVCEELGSGLQPVRLFFKFLEDNSIPVFGFAS